MRKFSVLLILITLFTFALGDTNRVVMEINKILPSGNFYDNGDEVSYTVVIENLGENPVKGDLNVPFGSLGYFTKTSIDGDSEVNNLNIKDVQLLSGESKRYNLKGIIGPEVSSSITLDGTFTYGENLVKSSSNPIERVKYSLSGTMEASKSYYELGGEVIYVITLKNTGDSIVKNISLEDNLNFSDIFQSSKITSMVNGGITNGGVYGPSGSLNVTGAILDIGGTIKYIIAGKVKDTYRGPIESNFTYNVRGENTQVKGPTLNLVKYSYGGTLIGNEKTYVPGGNINFALNIENKSTTIPISNMVVNMGFSSIKVKGPRGNFIDGINMGDLKDKYLIEYIGPGESKSINFTCNVNKNAVGPIEINPIITDRNGDSLNVTPMVFDSKPGLFSLKRFISTKQKKYYPGDSWDYVIEIGNSSEGIAYGGTLEDKIGDIVTKLSNSGDGNSSLDTEGSPFKSWNITMESTGEVYSDLLSKGSTVSNSNLEDKNIIIYPGGTLTYKISCKTNNRAIGPIINGGKLSGMGEKENLSMDPILPEPLETKGEIKKYTTRTEYEPGDIITYTIEAKNPSNTEYLNNLKISDYISEIKALDYNNNLVNAFESWSITVDKTGGLGTAPGTFNYGVFNPGNENLSLNGDIGPGGYITYILKCKVNKNVVGPIIDNIKNDTVQEIGTAIKMAPPKLRVSKNVDSTEYTPGSYLIYDIRVENHGNGIGVNIPIEDELDNIKTTLIDKSLGKAYKSWTIDSSVYSIDGGDLSGVSDSGMSGTLSNVPLNVKGRIYPGEGILYKIKAYINDMAQGEIINRARANSELISDRGAITRAPNVTMNVMSNVGSYPVSDNKITYTIVFKNNKTSGFALGVPVKDEISKISGELLRGGSGTVFKNWTTKVTTSGIGSSIDKTPGPNEDIDTKVNIAPGGEVIIKITGTIDNRGEDHIFYGSFTNKVLGNGTSKSVTIVPKAPLIKIIKKVEENYYDLMVTEQKYVHYEILVENNGSGYLNNGILQDSLKSIVDKGGNIALKTFTISVGELKGKGTYVYSFNKNENLNVPIDIAPKGYVLMKVVGTLNDNVHGEIVNKGTISDDKYGIHLSATATIDELQTENTDNNTIYVHKYTDTLNMTPGEDFTYHIEVYNNSSKPLKNIAIDDNLDRILGRGANDGNGTISDVPNVKVFDSWNVETGGLPGDLKPWEKLNFTIKAHVNPKILPERVKNIVTVHSKTPVNGKYEVYGRATVTNGVLGGYGNISKVIKVNGITMGALGRYVPGDEITYTIKIANSGRGYLNNYRINENISGIMVDLLGGENRGNLFNNNWTLTFEKNLSKITKGNTVPIPEGDIKNNGNLNGVVDIAPGDYLVYEVKGKIRKDIGGDINIGGSKLEPYRYNLKISKKADGLNYEPGHEITYTLTAENNSSGNGSKINLLDDLGAVKVLGLSGEKISAFTSINSVTVEKTGEGTIGDIPSNYRESKELNTNISLPIGGKVVYKVNATVSDKAVGTITNILNVGEDKVSSGVSSARDRMKISNKILNYMDGNKNILSEKKYTPGGYITYEITLKNTGAGSVDNYKLEDSLSTISSDYGNGTRGKVFDSWTIEADYNKNGISSPGSFSNNKDINTLVDMGPGETITYKIVGKLNQNLVGNFVNSIYFNGVRRDSGNSQMGDSKVLLTQSILDDKTYYAPGDEITYLITLENTGLGTSYNREFLDDLSNITSEVSGNGTFRENPFENWEVIPKFFTPSMVGNNLSGLGDYEIKPGNSLNTKSLIIAPMGGKVEFTIKCKIKPITMGKIINKVAYDNLSKSTTVKPYGGRAELTNIVETLGGKTYTSSMNYVPGEKITYLLKVKNTGRGYLKNVPIRDDFNGVLGKLGGVENRVPVLRNILLTKEIVPGDVPGKTYLQVSSSKNYYLDEIGDIAPGATVVYKMSGNISSRALGTIGENSFSVGNLNKLSPKINSAPSVIVASKNLVDTGLNTYKPGDIIKYRLFIENKGKGYSDNLKINDLLGNIKGEIIGETMGNIFTGCTISRNINNKNTNSPTYIDGTTTALGIVERGDIAPGDSVEYLIDAKVGGNVVGKVYNMATVGDKKLITKELTLEPVGKGKLIISKNVDEMVNGSYLYNPGGSIKYKIIVENNSLTTLNDLKLEDYLSNIETELSGDLQGKALEGNWTIVPRLTRGNIENAYLRNIKPSGNLNGTVDLPKESTLEIDINAIGGKRALGTIDNSMNWSYTPVGTQIVRAKTLNPSKGKMSISLSGSSEKYSPGKNFTYTIKVKNIGPGFINNGEIRDNLRDILIKTVDKGENKGLGQMTLSEVSSLSQNTVITEKSLVDNMLYVKGDIAPGDIVTIKVSGVVNEEGIGPLTNVVTGTYNKENVSSNTLTVQANPGIISGTKAVVGSGGPNYEDNGPLVYTLTLKNTGLGWAYDIPVKDEISKILSKSVSGNDESALGVKSIDIKNIKYISGDYSGPKDLNCTIGLAPGATGEIIINTVVNNHIVGKIENTGVVNGENTNTVISTPKITSFNLSLNSDSKNYTYSSVDKNGGYIIYTISLENKGKSSGVLALKDLLGEIKVKSNKNQVINAFKNWELLSVTKPQRSDFTISSKVNEITTKDLEVWGVFEATKEKLVLKVKCYLNETPGEVPMENIENTVALHYKENVNTTSVIVEKSPSILGVKKKILTLNGSSFTGNETYKPGDTIEYLITVENSGLGFGDNVTIKDDLNKLTGELFGNKIGNLILNGTMEENNSSPFTYSMVKGDSNGIEGTINLGPKSTSTFKVKGVINPLALGTIPKNQVTLGNLSGYSEELKGALGSLKYSGEILSGKTYYPGSKITYLLSVENDGKGYLDDIPVGDILSSIKTTGIGEKDVNPFSKTVIALRVDGQTQYFLNNTYPLEGSDLNDKLDLSPGGKVEFLITGTVKPGIYGDIENILQVNNNKISLVSKPILGNIKLEKNVINPTYVPEGDVAYTIKIENNSQGIAHNVNLQDLIGNIKSLNGQRDLVQALNTWDISYNVQGSPDQSLVNIPESGNIDVNMDLGPNTTVNILIKGKVNDGIRGYIKNSARVEYNGEILLGSATINPELGVISSKLEAQRNYYLPGGPIFYRLSIENSGRGYGTNISVIDDLRNVLGVDPSTLHVMKMNLGSKSNIVENNGIGGKLDYVLDLYPKDSVEIYFTILANSTAMDPIINKAQVTYNKEVENLQSKVISVDGKFSIRKSESIEKYIPGENIVYTITMRNKGKGWLKDISVKDPMGTMVAEGIGGKNINVFSEFNLVKIGSSNLKVDKNSEGFIISGNLPPKSSTSVVLQGTINKNLLGDIENIGTGVYKGGNYSSNVVVATQEVPKIDGTFTVDKKNYLPNKELTYTLTLENKSKNNIGNINVRDLIKNVLVLNSDGKMVNAFKDKIKIEVEKGNNCSYESLDESGNLNGTVDILSGEKVIIKITGTLIDNPVGDVQNSVQITSLGNSITLEALSKPTKPDIHIKKIIEEKAYIPGKPIHYFITVLNGPDGGYGDNIVVSDDILSMRSETLSGMDSPFDVNSGEIKIYSESEGILSTLKKGPKEANLKDMVDIPPGRAITYEVTEIVKKDVLGEIENIAYGGDKSAKAKISSEPYKLQVKVAQKTSEYIPGKDVEFTLNIKNIGYGVGSKIPVKEIISDIFSEDIDGNKKEAFTKWTVESEGKDAKGFTTLENRDLDEDISILSGGEVTYKFKGTVDKDLLKDIDIDISVDKNSKNPIEKRVVFTPPKPNIKVTKVANKKNYIDTDKYIIYTMTIENSGLGNLRNIKVVDDISKLKGKNGNPLFKTWTGTVLEEGEVANGKLVIAPNNNINTLVNLRGDGQNKIIFKIKGVINKGLDDDITNVFYGVDPISKKKIEASVTTHVKKIPDNTGTLHVIKRVLKNRVRIGEPVDYEVKIENPNESRFLNITLEDIAPKGFHYINNSSILTYSISKKIENKNPTLVNGNLEYRGIYLEPFESVTIKYRMKPSIGVTLGKYENIAYVTLKNNIISNRGKAYVIIEPDPLLNKGSVIGKVFEDLNNNGYQDDPTIKNVKIYRKNKVVNLGNLKGNSKYRKVEGNEKTYTFYSDSSNFENIKITVKGNINKKNLNVEKNIYKNRKTGKYLHEIIVRNSGYYEEGIPGVKLITPKGIVVTTDNFGRYHIPQEWILDRKGKNLLIKLDTSSLPKNMEVEGENPLVKRITPEGLSKFNFPVKDKVGGKNEN